MYLSILNTKSYIRAGENAGLREFKETFAQSGSIRILIYVQSCCGWLNNTLTNLFGELLEGGPVQLDFRVTPSCAGVV